MGGSGSISFLLRGSEVCEKVRGTNEDAAFSEGRLVVERIEEADAGPVTDGAATVGEAGAKVAGKLRLKSAPVRARSNPKNSWDPLPLLGACKELGFAENVNEKEDG